MQLTQEQQAPIKVLNDGFIRLVSVMDDENAIVQAARVSYQTGTKTPSDDVTLIRYLMRHRHTTPLEMVEFKFHSRVPMDTWRQWIRHRMASVNEYSTRYSEAIDSQQTTAPDEWRLQSDSNKQGSTGMLVAWPEGWSVINDADNPGFCFISGPAEGTTGVDRTTHIVVRCAMVPEPAAQTPGGYLSWLEEQSHVHSGMVYSQRLELGVAREQARKDLPLSTYTEAYWKIDLHNLLHFLSLRMDPHAQLEIRQYANAIGRIVGQLLPNVWQAFKDYRLDAMQLTRLDIEVLRSVTSQRDGGFVGSIAELDAAIDAVFPPHEGGRRNREGVECRAKLIRLGLLPDPLAS